MLKSSSCSNWKVSTSTIQLKNTQHRIGLDKDYARNFQERNAKEIIASICIAYLLHLRRKHHELLDKYMIDTYFGFVDRGIGGGPPP
jgi:hypothetical protein